MKTPCRPCRSLLAALGLDAAAQAALKRQGVIG